MIIDAVLDLLQALAEILLAMVPVPESAPDTAGWTTATSRISSDAGWVSHFLPIGLAAWCAIAILSWSLTCWALSVLFVVARRIRLIG